MTRLLPILILAATASLCYAEEVVLDCRVKVNQELDSIKTSNDDVLRVVVEQGRDVVIDLKGLHLRGYFFTGADGKSVGAARSKVFNGSTEGKWFIESETLTPEYRARAGITIDRRSGSFEYWSNHLGANGGKMNYLASGSCERARNRF